MNSWRDYLKTGLLTRLELPWFYPHAVRALLEVLGTPVPDGRTLVFHRQEPLGHPISSNPIMHAWWGYGPTRQIPERTAVFAIWIAGLDTSSLPGRMLFKFPLIGGQLWVAEDTGARCWRLYLWQWGYRFRVSPLRFSSEAAAVKWADDFVALLVRQWGYELQHTLDRWVGEDPHWFNRTPERYKTGWIGCMYCSIRQATPKLGKEGADATST